VNILGVSFNLNLGHDSSAALIQDGKIIAAAQEERFNRVKHDDSFPLNSIQFCLKTANLTIQDIDFLAVYIKPLSHFERNLELYLRSMKYNKKSLFPIPRALKIQFLYNKIIKECLRAIPNYKTGQMEILFAEHHEAHAASAFYPSPFKNAAILTIDGTGEWATTAAWIGENNKIRPLWEIRYPHSLGLLYQAFTDYLGFEWCCDEYKVMGLAPYGEPRYADLIKRYLIDIKADGTFRLNMKYFQYHCGCLRENSKFNKLFGGPPRRQAGPLTQKHIDIACSIQNVAEEVILKLAQALHKETGQKYLCLAGGVALNCVANGKILKQALFKNIWVQPGAGDEGGAIGSALCVWHNFLNKKRIVKRNDGMQGAYLGPAFSDRIIREFLDKNNIRYKQLADKALFNRVSSLISGGKVIGWFQGRMEFGPRALGNRSILADARNPQMQSILNRKIKHRESFRPFAPAVLKEKTADYFDLNIASPYMNIIAYVKQGRCSDIPAVTHVDYSSRLQTVDGDTNPKFYKLIKNFESKTGCAVLINTSFNTSGEPIVCAPEDAYRCFMKTEIDFLVLGNMLLDKKLQKGLKGRPVKPDFRIADKIAKKNKFFVFAADKGFAFFWLRGNSFYIKKHFKRKKIDLAFRQDVLTYRKFKKGRPSSNFKKQL